MVGDIIQNQAEDDATVIGLQASHGVAWPSQAGTTKVKQTEATSSKATLEGKGDWT